MNEQVRPPALKKKSSSWMNRNWKWFVPLLVVGSGAVMVTMFIAIFMVVFSLMKSSGAYEDAVARAHADEAVQTALGTPIEEGLFVMGNINVSSNFGTGNNNTSGSTGQADISIPISGPKGKATIYAIATKSAGAWNFSTLVVEIKDTGERINLLE